MIPKLASQLLQLKSHSSHHLRNVLQSSGTSSSGLPWSGVGSSSSSWGGSTGAGGAKFNAGSRFYAGYTGPGRVLTQATSISSGDGTSGQIDDSDERAAHGPHVKRQSIGRSPLRPRRNSIALSTPRPSARNELSSALQATQLHARFRHAFVAEDRPHTTAAPLPSVPSTPRLRRNSTSAISTESGSLRDDVALPSRSESAEPAIPTLQTSLDDEQVANLQGSSSPQPVVVPDPVDLSNSVAQEDAEVFNDESTGSSPLSLDSSARDEALQLSMSLLDLEIFDGLSAAKRAGSLPMVLTEVRKLRQSEYPYSVGTYNMALDALCTLRARGTPIAVILELYNEMLERNVVPNVRTYEHVIRALCARDVDIQMLNTDGAYPGRPDRGARALLSTIDRAPEFADSRTQLLAEDNFGSAMALFNAAKALRKQQFSIQTYNHLLHSASYRGDIDNAIGVYTHLERRSDIRPAATTFRHLLDVYAQAGDIEGAREVFNEFKLASRTGRISWVSGGGEKSTATFGGPPALTTRAKRAHMQVYNRMLAAYFECSEPGGALALLEEMVSSNSGPDFSPSDVPSPSASTYTEIITGFCTSGDLDTAVTWFDRLLMYKTTAPGSDPYVASLVPLRPDHKAWHVMLARLAEAGRVETFNRLFSVMLTCVPHDGFILRPEDVSLLVATNMQLLLSDQALSDRDRSAALIDYLNDVLPKCATLTNLARHQIYEYQWLLTKGLVRIGKLDDAVRAAESVARNELLDISDAQASGIVWQNLQHGFRRSFVEAAYDIFGLGPGPPFKPSLDVALALTKLVNGCNLFPTAAMHGALIQAYLNAKVQGQYLHRPHREWVLISNAFRSVEKTLRSTLATPEAVHDRQELQKIFGDVPFPGIVSFIDDLRFELQAYPLDPPMHAHDLQAVYWDLKQLDGVEHAQQVIRSLGPFGDQVLRGRGGVERRPTADDDASKVIPADTLRLRPGATDSVPANSPPAFQTESLTESESAGGGESVSDGADTVGSTMTATSATTAPSASTPESTTRSVIGDASTKTGPPQVTIDHRFSNHIDLHRSRFTFPPEKAYLMVLENAGQGVYPTPETLGRLMNSLARAGLLDQARNLYAIAQTVLNALENDKDSQTRGWFMIEDQMLCAHAFVGDIESATIHRTRILEHGGVPSAESYAVLIMNTNDTTDDCGVAMALYNEAVTLGVVPNVFLYNNIISKLSRARKAEAALGIFHEMKNTSVRPTSVTYGALIGACCRVGDADSAMFLFSEMSSQVNFKPKAPPFNTMMQFFTHSKPDRDRVLYYYNLMLAANVRPTAHTYKILMDCYGMIEPVDMNAMQMVFDKLASTRSLQVQGTHWASLVTAWGCSCKDVDRAQAVFDSIPSHPSTLVSRTTLPDATTWEALFNVIVSQHRFDLMPATIERLRNSGLHMTAYIANVLIRGYGASGRIEDARTVFESLADPPAGMAAAFNHVPHTSEEIGDVSSDAPVYREPSTWETMVRVEMGAGDLARAEELLARMEARHFPPAVRERIRGIVGKPSSEVIQFAYNGLSFLHNTAGSETMDISNLPFGQASSHGQAVASLG